MIGKFGKFGKRRSTVTATTLACAAMVLGTPAVAQAQSAIQPPAKPSPRTPASSKTLEEVRKEMDKLYHRAAVATDAYNAAEEKAKDQSAEIVRLARAIVRGQNKLDDLKKRAGAAARAQYRSGGMPPQAQLVLSDDPAQFLNHAGRLRQGQQATKGLLGEMSRTQSNLRSDTADAQTQWKKLEENRKRKAAAKKEIEAKIKAAKALESKLEKKERERLLELEQAAQYKRQMAWLDKGTLKELNGRASASGKKAVKYATAQLGKPYEWGAEGPKTYDCSGLTSQAWIAAGQTIPRTSQEQWKQLPRIDIKDMRPGDLIIYHKDASHVGMYIGDGAIVHAPRPGRHITVAGAGSMYILGVVRPDK